MGNLKLSRVVFLLLFSVLLLTSCSNGIEETKEENLAVEEKPKEDSAETEKELEEEVTDLHNWNGEWQRMTQNYEGTLNISNFDGDSFNLSISVMNGANMGDMEGVAIVEGDQATYTDAEYDTGCRLDMTLTEDSIQVETNDDCWNVGGMGTFFYGEYMNEEKAVNQPKDTLVSLDILIPEQDEVVRELVGEDYDILVSHMQNVEFSPGQESFLVKGGVKGLYSIKESVIWINIFGDYNIASIIDGEKIRFYTNEEGYKDKLPTTIEDWSENFSDYPVEYIYKNIKGYSPLH